MDKITSTILGIMFVLVAFAALFIFTSHQPQTLTTEPMIPSNPIIHVPVQTPWPVVSGSPDETPILDVPTDPGHGPIPVCQIHPGQGLAPGATCPPKR